MIDREHKLSVVRQARLLASAVAASTIVRVRYPMAILP